LTEVNFITEDRMHAEKHIHWGLDISSANIKASSVSIQRGVSVSIWVSISVLVLVFIQGNLGNCTSTVSSTDTEAVLVFVQEGALGIHIVLIKFVRYVNHEGGVSVTILGMDTKTPVYVYENAECLQTNKMQHCLGWERKKGNAN
jgi:hypothetical protein